MALGIGSQRRKNDIARRGAPENIYGNLLPQRDFVVSEIWPIKGSSNASINLPSPIKIPRSPIGIKEDQKKKIQAETA